MTDAPFTETHRETLTNWYRSGTGNAAELNAAIEAALLHIKRLEAENTQLREELDAVQSDIDEGRQR